MVLAKDSKLGQNTPYIEWNIYTEPMMINGEVWVLYPLVEHGVVRDVFGVVLNDSRNLIRTYLISSETEYYYEFKGKMSAALEQLGKPKTEQLSYNRGMMAKVRCTDEEICGIDEVVITVPRPRKFETFVPKNVAIVSHENPLECLNFHDCFDWNIGGGGDPKPKDHQYPCKKVSDKLNNPKVTLKINELKNNAKLNGEKGFNIKANGEPSTVVDGGEGSHSLNMGDMRGCIITTLLMELLCFLCRI